MVTPESTPSGASHPDVAQQEPMTPLESSAASLHEMYLALMKAGFSELQAIRIVTGMITEAGRARGN